LINTVYNYKPDLLIFGHADLIKPGTLAYLKDNYKNLKKFNKRFLNTFNEHPNKVSILAYDALGLIYYCWSNNNFEFKQNQLYNKKGFKGLHGEFFIENNLSKHKLKIYKVLEKKFVKVY